MKRILTLGIMFILLSNLTLAAVKAPAVKTEKIVSYSGVIIDSTCAKAHKQDIAKFAKTHTKACALKPDCAASGYVLYTNGKLVAFDDESSTKIEKFLKKWGSKTSVNITAKIINGKLNLVSIKNK